MDSIVRRRFNIALLGETEVGKTSIIAAKQGYGNIDRMVITIGIEDYYDNITFNDTNYKIKIIDTPGAERYKSASRATIKLSVGLIIVFSVDNRKSFELANYDWLRFIKEDTDKIYDDLLKNAEDVFTSDNYNTSNLENGNDEIIDSIKYRN